MSLTGAFANHRFATPPDTIETVIVAIASALSAPVDWPSLLQDQALFIDAIAKDLQAHPGHELVLVGPSLANAAPLGVWINDRLGAPADCFDLDAEMSAAGCAGACMSAGL